jgi:hypothetical protein
MENKKRRYGSDWCSAFNCKNSRQERKDLTFFTFSHHDEER